MVLQIDIIFVDDDDDDDAIKEGRWKNITTVAFSWASNDPKQVPPLNS